MKEKKTSTNSYFSLELFAMAFALLCTLSLVCLISGDMLFGDLGLLVRRFYLGVFGYTSFLFLIGGIYLGVKGVIGFKVKSKAVKAIVVYAFLYLLFIVTIVQTAINAPGGSFSEYASACYANGLSFESCTAGGVLFGLFVFALSALLTKVGSFAACSLALAFITLYFFRTPLKALFARMKGGSGETDDSDEKTDEKAVEKSRRRAKKVKNDDADFEETDDFAIETEGEKKGVSPLLGMGGEFKLKSEKDKRLASDKENSIKVLFGDGTTSAATGGGRVSYGESYDADLAAKTEYILRPREGQGVKFTRPTGEPDEKADFSSSDECIDIDVDSPDKDVYVLRNEGGRARARVSAFDEASGRSSDDYNRDRFTRPEEFDASRSTERRTVTRPVTDDENEMEDETPRTARSRYEERRGRSGRIIVENAEEDGNTPNADVLRKLRRTSAKPAESPTAERSTESDVETSESFDRSMRASRSFGTETKPLSDDFTSAETRRYESRTADEDDGEDFSPEKPSSSEQTERASGDVYDRSAERARVSDSERARVPDDEPKKEPIKEPEKEEPMKENPIDKIPKNYRFNFPPLRLLNDYKPDAAVLDRIKKEQTARRQTILDILNNPDIGAQIADIKVGPSLTRFEITIPTKVPMRKVTEKYEDLNLWMEARSRIRIVAPIPGTSRIGLEVPNSELSTVGLKQIINSDEFKNAKKSSITFGLGKDMVGETVVADISKMPHLLVAGATGTGKSVFLNTLLVSLIYKYSPEDLRIVLVDPKFVEFSVYKGIPELLFGEIFTEASEACAMLDWMVAEMERRYQIFREGSVRDINEYNEKVEGTGEKKMFRILVLMDEFADLMNQQNDKKRMDTAISRLAAKARAAGIHLILATQRPTTDIVDGSIKTNFPSRIVFKMSSQTDAIVVMGEAGAEKLLGDGDMLYKVAKMTNTERAQGAFINAKEVSDVCEYVKVNNKTYYDDCALDSILKAKDAPESSADDADGGSAGGSGGEEGVIKGAAVEENFIKAAMRIAINGSNVSISLLQRKLGVGYPKAGKIVDVLESRGYISAQVDNNKRKILMTAEQFEQTFGEPL